MEPPSLSHAQVAHLASKFPGMALGNQQQPTAKRDLATHTFVIHVPAGSKDRIISYKELLKIEQEKFLSQHCPSYADNDLPSPLAESALTTATSVNGTGKLKPQTLETAGVGDDGSDTEETLTTKTGNNDYYHLDDPFIDDSELNLDVNVGLVRPKQDGFFVCYGKLETVPVDNLEHLRPKRRPKTVVKGKAATKNRIKDTSANSTSKSQPAVSDTDTEMKGTSEETVEKRRAERKKGVPRKKKSSGEDATTVSNAVPTAKLSISKPKASAAKSVKKTEIGDDEAEAIIATIATTTPKKAKSESSKKDKSNIVTTPLNSTRVNAPSTTDIEMEDFSTEGRIQDTAVVEGSSTKPAKPRKKKVKKVDATDAVTASPSNCNSDIAHEKAVKPRKKKSKKKEAETEVNLIAATDASQSKKSKPKAKKDKTESTAALLEPLAAPVTASESKIPVSIEHTPTKTENTLPEASHSTTPADITVPKILSPEVTEIVESLKTAAATETFENKTKFPARLRNIFLQAGRVHLDETEGILSDLLVTKLNEFLPYNRATIKKLLLSHLLPERQQNRQRKHLQLIEEFKTILEATLAPQRKEFDEKNDTQKEKIPPIEAMDMADNLSTSGSPLRLANILNPEMAKDDAAPLSTILSNSENRKFKFNFALREKLYDVVRSALDICNAENKLNELLKKPDRQTEHAARASIYAQLAALWPQGWITTSIIGIQYSGVKHRKEGSAKKITGPKLMNGEGKPKKEMLAINGNALTEGTSNSKLEVAKKRKPTTDSEAPHQINHQKKSKLAEPKEISEARTSENGTVASGSVEHNAVVSPQHQRMTQPVVLISSTKTGQESPNVNKPGHSGSQ